MLGAVIVGYALYALLALLPCRPGRSDNFAEVIAERSPELQRIDRYERRALSRRKKAIRALATLSGTK